MLLIRNCTYTQTVSLKPLDIEPERQSNYDMQPELTERDKIIFAIYLNEESENLAFFNKHLEALTNLIVQITEKLASEKVQLKRHEDYFETHYFKFIIQVLSLKHLYEGTPINSIKPDFKLHDLSTLYNCTRSLMETFLTINYLYYNHKNEDQANFRYLLYMVSGLNHRQTYPTNQEGTKMKQKFEKGEMEKHLTEIKANSHFLLLDQKKKGYLLNKLPALEIKKEEVIVESGLDNVVFHTMWRLYSNYAHSEFIEAMQLRDYIKNPKQQNGTLYGTYRLCFMLTSYQIIKLTEKFPLAKIQFDEQTLEIRTIIESYNRLLYGLKLNGPTDKK